MSTAAAARSPASLADLQAEVDGLWASVVGAVRAVTGGVWPARVWLRGRGSQAVDSPAAALALGRAVAADLLTALTAEMAAVAEFEGRDPTVYDAASAYGRAARLLGALAGKPWRRAELVVLAADLASFCRLVGAARRGA